MDVSSEMPPRPHHGGDVIKNHPPPSKWGHVSLSSDTFWIFNREDSLRYLPIIIACMGVVSACGAVPRKENSNSTGNLRTSELAACALRHDAEWPKNASVQLQPDGAPFCLRIEAALLEREGEERVALSGLLSDLKSLETEEDFGENAMYGMVSLYLSDESSRPTISSFVSASKAVVGSPAYGAGNPINLAFRAQAQIVAAKTLSPVDVMSIFLTGMSPCLPTPPPEAAGRSCFVDSLEFPFYLTRLAVHGQLSGDVYFNPYDVSDRSVWEAVKRTQRMSGSSVVLRRALLRAWWVIGGSAHQEIEVNLWPRIDQLFTDLERLRSREKLEDKCLDEETGYLAIEPCHAEIQRRLAAQ